MVTIEPFFYQKTTAFKERLQMINKINEIIEKINSGDVGITEEEVREIITTELSNYYTKEEVDDAIGSIDLSPYATITYVDNEIDSIDLTPYATNVRVNNEVETINDRIDNEVETLDDKIDTKQDIISVTTPLDLVNNEISLKDFRKISTNEYNLIVHNEFASMTFLTDVIFYYGTGFGTPIFIPKGTSNSGTDFKIVIPFIHSSKIRYTTVDLKKIFTGQSVNVVFTDFASMNDLNNGKMQIGIPGAFETGTIPIGAWNVYARV